ncbi:MAG: insulinase family protein, partial [Muribaculaceae bacterium]|nr:insulinase family protein [Muribaculaceae bacterium]
MCAAAQTPLPLNPKVKHGVLPNGLTYYILHNEMPKERANFYIAQKVGSTLEEQSQLGLAHFLEHMAFNGTKNYPGKNMLNYLQGKGIRFGADINAYTSFDETVYNINNVPTTDHPLMDSVLLVLRDWSGDILLEESEINAERGVIQEEWRSRNNASLRMYTQMLPKIYEEYQYHQMPIGSLEVVMNFKPEELRAYYKKWYRPDQQGIIIVGDFDADEMEKKVIDMFSTIPMPENAAERKYPSVSDNKEPIYFAYTDPELTSPRTTISFKSEKVPFELRNTVEVYTQHDLVQSLIAALINGRLQENSVNPNCLYSGAGVYFGDYYV